MRKPGIPAVPTGLPSDHHRILETLKENVEIMGGVRSARIEPLPSTATLAQVISTVNDLIDRLSPDA